MRRRGKFFCSPKFILLLFFVSLSVSDFFIFKIHSQEGRYSTYMLKSRASCWLCFKNDPPVEKARFRNWEEWCRRGPFDHLFSKPQVKLSNQFQFPCFFFISHFLPISLVGDGRLLESSPEKLDPSIVESIDLLELSITFFCGCSCFSTSYIFVII